MIIYDTKKNFKNSIRGMLYLNLIDVDYLISKYSSVKLKRILPFDYVTTFEEELDALIFEDKLSKQYYSLLSLGICDDEDENLVNILAKEVFSGNMFTKGQLESLSKEELDSSMQMINLSDRDIYLLSKEELYKLRSYQMARYIIQQTEMSEKFSDIMQAEITGYGYRNEARYDKAFYEYKKCLNNISGKGFSEDIYESDYFIKKSKEMQKKIEL